jgi:hypothetical protein
MKISLISRFLLLLTTLFSFGCGGTGLEGEYLGKIGQKSNVTIRFFDGTEAEIQGYWNQNLKGTYKKSSIKGEHVDSIVFLGPSEKPFKLRVCYQAIEDHIEILAIHSRVFGPGARYIQTESDSVFGSQNPKLYKVE